MAHRVVAVIADELHGSRPLDELRRGADGQGLDLRVVVPAVEASRFQHTLGEVDEPRQQAERRLRACLEVIRGAGLEARGEVGDPDPVQAAQDALLKEPADEVVIFEHEARQARWFEEGLIEHAEASLEPPLRIVDVHSHEASGDEIVEVERQGRGTVDPDAGRELATSYLPGLSRGDFAGVVAGIVGTIVAGVLAAAAAANAGEETGLEAAAILIAIGIALINLAHVVGLVLMESVRYRGGFSAFFRTLSLVLTPTAVLANLLILIFD